MNVKEDKKDVGILVGRFQVPFFHEAHKDLINTVKSKHDRVIVFLGNAAIRGSLNNPLDFRSRRTMFNEEYPDIEVHYIKDVNNDELWSKTLDKMIGDLLIPNQTCTLYGSRDSFIGHYKGKYSTCELESTTFVSGTDIRKKVTNSYPATKDYRAGVIAGTANQYPSALPTVDIAIFNDKGEILLARKPDEKQYRFIGGFASPDSNSYEDDAKREVMEESGIEIGGLTYIGSFKIDDWRYKNETNQIKTLFFIAKYVFGRPEGADDVAEVKWVNINTFKPATDLVLEHQQLWAMLIKYLVMNDINNIKNAIDKL